MRFFTTNEYYVNRTGRKVQKHLMPVLFFATFGVNVKYYPQITPTSGLFPTVGTGNILYIYHILGSLYPSQTADKFLFSIVLTVKGIFNLIFSFSGVYKGFGSNGHLSSVGKGLEGQELTVIVHVPEEN